MAKVTHTHTHKHIHVKVYGKKEQQQKDGIEKIAEKKQTSKCR